MNYEEHRAEQGDAAAGAHSELPSSGFILLKAGEDEMLSKLISKSGAKKETFEEWVRLEYKRREKRRNLFPGDILGEPCWDMLLDLAAASLDARITAVSSLCVASGAPQTTALRWLQLLEKHRLVLKSPHPVDGRRVNVSISDAGMAALRAYHGKYIS
jgi:DNA-binding MarR family transcriptional regulator